MLKSRLLQKAIHFKFLMQKSTFWALIKKAFFEYFHNYQFLLVTSFNYLKKQKIQLFVLFASFFNKISYFSTIV